MPFRFATDLPMPSFEVTTELSAPIERCFDLARDTDFHQHTMAHTGEHAVAGVTSGLIGLNETVTWEARHLFIKQRMAVRITAFDRPHHFRDEQIAGPFKRFVHDHFFESLEGKVQMIDRVAFASPLGPLGAFVDMCFMRRYLRRLIAQRGQVMREACALQDPPDAPL